MSNSVLQIKHQPQIIENMVSVMFAKPLTSLRPCNISYKVTKI